MKVRSFLAGTSVFIILSLLFMGFSQIDKPEYPNDIVRGPYLQMVGPNSATIVWVTGSPAKSKVLYGRNDSIISEVADKGRRKKHEVVISGLEPDTKYYYSIIAPDGQKIGGEAFYFHTAPLPATPKPVNIWVIGDAGSGYPGQNKMRDGYLKYAAGIKTDLWLWLGDNAYEVGKEEEFQKNVFTGHFEDLMRNIPVYPTLGNHDMHNFGYQTILTRYFPFAYYDIFALPKKGELGGVPSGTEKYYSFDYANIHFISLDSYSSCNKPGGEMNEWLEKDLASTQQKWVICYFHHPPYCKGTHDSDLDKESIDVRENLVPLFEKYRVDLVLSGHSHAYERTFPLRGHYSFSSTLADSMIYRSDGSNIYHKKEKGWIIYAVVGASGKPGGKTSGWPHKAMAFYHCEDNGSMCINVKGDSLKAEYINTQGNVLDKFIIVKETSSL
ncbi:MAG TPA: metallophosphoesterase [Cytophagaceae bacterium]